MSPLGRIFFVGSFLVGGLTMLFCAVLAASEVVLWPWHSRSLKAWMDTAGLDIFIVYFLGGMGIIVCAFAIGPLRQRLFAAIGSSESDSRAGTYRFELFGPLLSAIYRYVGVLFLMIAFLIAYTDLHEEKPVTAGNWVAAIVIGGTFLILGLLLAFFRWATVVDASTHSVISETRIWLVVTSLTFRRTRPMSDFDRIRVERIRISGQKGTPPSVYCDVRLVPKAGGRGAVLLSTREPSTEEGVSPEVLSFANEWSRATGLPLDVG